MQKHGDRIGAGIVRSLNVRSASNRRDAGLNVENLIGTNYVGCGCSGRTKKEASKSNGKTFFWSEWKKKSDDETLVLNLDGKDTELKLISKGERPEKEKVGDKFTDEYLLDDTKVILDYVTKKLPCETCEETEYEVTATIIGEFDGKVVSLIGSCGC